MGRTFGRVNSLGPTIGTSELEALTSIPFTGSQLLEHLTTGLLKLSGGQAGKIIFGNDSGEKGAIGLYLADADTADSIVMSADKHIRAGAGGATAVDASIRRLAAGRWAFSAKGTTAPAAGEFSANEEVMLTRASDTSLRLSLRGADGTVRHATVAVA